MTESLHHAEVRYIRAQMVIAALNLVATSILTGAGLWIAHGVNMSSSAQHDDDSRRETAFRCLDLRMRELSFDGEGKTDSIKDRRADVDMEMEIQCARVGLKFADDVPATKEQMRKDVQSFLDWAAEPKSG